MTKEMILMIFRLFFILPTSLLLQPKEPQHEGHEDDAVEHRVLGFFCLDEVVHYCLPEEEGYGVIQVHNDGICKYHGHLASKK